MGRSAPDSNTSWLKPIDSLSRPRVSNDNPKFESCFKTIKYQPDYPGRAEFFALYADQHRHSGLALFTPADVFFGRVEGIANTRQRAMDVAFEAHPERFVKGRPQVRRPTTTLRGRDQPHRPHRHQAARRAAARGRRRVHGAEPTTHHGANARVPRRTRPQREPDIRFKHALVDQTD